MKPPGLLTAEIARFVAGRLDDFRTVPGWNPPSLPMLHTLVGDSTHFGHFFAAPSFDDCVARPLIFFHTLDCDQILGLWQHPVFK